MAVTATEADFAPLAQAISQFGLPNPLTVLPQLQNRLETVDTSSVQLLDVHAHLDALAQRLDEASGSLGWKGEVPPHFHHHVGEVSRSLRNTATSGREMVKCQQDTSVTVWDLAVWITLALMVVSLFVLAVIALGAATFALTCGASLAESLHLAATALGTTHAVIVEFIGGAMWVVSNILSEMRTKLDSHPITCPIPSA